MKSNCNGLVEQSEINQSIDENFNRVCHPINPAVESGSVSGMGTRKVASDRSNGKGGSMPWAIK
jgi:hypothetical protein